MKLRRAQEQLADAVAYYHEWVEGWVLPPSEKARRRVEIVRLMARVRDLGGDPTEITGSWSGRWEDMTEAQAEALVGLPERNG